MKRQEHLKSTRGSTLVWALLARIIVSGLILSTTVSLQANSRQVETRFRSEAQSLDVARAGVIDAYAWFRRQPTQPASTFAPALDLSAMPPVNETDDASIGLVREFEIASGYWARYEVRKYVDLDADSRKDPGEGVYDLSQRRGLIGAGIAWHIESFGTIYRRLDDTVVLSAEPNYKIASAQVSAEIRQLAVILPGSAPILCRNGSDVTLENRSRLIAPGATGIVTPSSTGNPSTGNCEMTVGQTHSGVPGYDDSWNAVFGAKPEELMEMATVRLTAGETLPDLPEFAMVYVTGDLTVDSAAPLLGVGLLIVDGDLTIEAGSKLLLHRRHLRDERLRAARAVADARRDHLPGQGRRARRRRRRRGGLG